MRPVRPTVDGVRRSPFARDLRWLVVTTVRICLKHRVTGLAAEIGFFALLSLPPLVLGLAGTLGYFTNIIGADTVDHFRNSVIELARHALSDQTVADTIIPTLNDTLHGGRADVISMGFLLALWSGSRALNVTIDTISIMYGLGGRRGIIATRALSFSLYVVSLVVGIVLLPLLIGGPEFFELALPDQLSWIGTMYWPIIVVGSVASLTTLFWVALPVPNSWWRGLPGAALALGGAMLGSYFLRATLSTSIGGTSIYGPLTAPIVVLIWLYALAIVMLIGAAFNAATDRRWPHRSDATTLDGIPVRHVEARPTAPLRSAAGVAPNQKRGRPRYGP
jgi:membrane protein